MASSKLWLLSAVVSEVMMFVFSSIYFRIICCWFYFLLNSRIVNSFWDIIDWRWSATMLNLCKAMKRWGTFYHTNAYRGTLWVKPERPVTFTSEDRRLTQEHFQCWTSLLQIELDGTLQREHLLHFDRRIKHAQSP